MFPPVHPWFRMRPSVPPPLLYAVRSPRVIASFSVSLVPARRAAARLLGAMVLHEPKSFRCSLTSTTICESLFKRVPIEDPYAIIPVSSVLFVISPRARHLGRAVTRVRILPCFFLVAFLL